MSVCLSVCPSVCLVCLSVSQSVWVTSVCMSFWLVPRFSVWVVSSFIYLLMNIPNRRVLKRATVSAELWGRVCFWHLTSRKQQSLDPQQTAAVIFEPLRGRRLLLRKHREHYGNTENVRPLPRMGNLLLLTVRAKGLEKGNRFSRIVRKSLLFDPLLWGT